MRFRSEFIGQIRRGEKTQTRRPYKGTRCSYQAGHFYVIERVETVREEFKDAEGQTRIRYEDVRASLDEHIEVLAVHKQALGDLSEEDAEAEGFPDRESFLDYYEAEYGSQDPASFVWVIEFRLAGDVPMFLARQQGQADPPQYVSSPARAIDDAERVDPAYLSRWAERAHEQAEQQRELRRARDRQLEVEDRLARARARAREQGRDISKHLRVIERRLDEIERDDRAA